MRPLLGSVVMLLVSCTHVRAKDETVAQHRNDAAIHQAAARAELAQYDPTQTRRVPPRSAMVGADAVTDTLGQGYNPTREHLLKADAEMKEANDHLAAAKTLLTFENEACAGLSDGERSSCPLFASSVSRVQSTPKGFVMTMKPTADAPQTFQRLRCHLAYAVATGFDRPSCPLFLKGTTLRRVDDSGIAFDGDSEAVAIALRATARRVFVGGVEPSASR